MARPQPEKKNEPAAPVAVRAVAQPMKRDSERQQNLVEERRLQRAKVADDREASQTRSNTSIDLNAITIQQILDSRRTVCRWEDQALASAIEKRFPGQKTVALSALVEAWINDKTLDLKTLQDCVWLAKALARRGSKQLLEIGRGDEPRKQLQKALEVLRG